MPSAHAALGLGGHPPTRSTSGSRRQPTTLGKRTVKATDLLSSALASGALAKLVAYFTARPDHTPHIRALMRQTGLGARSLQVELERLERLGLIEREVAVNGQVHIRAAGRRAAWAPFRDLVQAYADPAELLHFAIGDVPGIAAAFVFGSVARGTADVESDIDLFVLAEQLSDTDRRSLERELGQRTVDASLGIGREVHCVILTVSQLVEKLSSGRVFYENVIAGPKRWVLGSSTIIREARRMSRNS